jgi:hypothetical protein
MGPGGLQWRWYTGQVSRIGASCLRVLLPVVAVLAVAVLLVFGALPAYGQTPTPWPVPSPETAPFCPPATPGLINGRVSEKLSGLVVVHPSPLSISGATVELLEYGLTTTTDANGCFAFELPATGGVVPLASARVTAAGYGSLTLANFPTHGDGINLSAELEPGGIAKMLDFCHFETSPDTAALQVQYAVCAEQGKLTTGFGSPPAALPDTGSGSLASGRQAIPVWLVPLLLAGAIGGIGAAARMAASVRSG